MAPRHGAGAAKPSTSAPPGKRLKAEAAPVATPAVAEPITTEPIKKEPPPSLPAENAIMRGEAMSTRDWIQPCIARVSSNLLSFFQGQENDQLKKPLHEHPLLVIAEDVSQAMNKF